MFEDIFTPTPQDSPKSPRPSRARKKPRPKKPAPEHLTAFEFVKQCDDLRMLTKILDLCKNKVRRQKRKARAARKKRNLHP